MQDILEALRRLSAALRADIPRGAEFVAQQLTKNVAALEKQSEAIQGFFQK